MDNKIIFFEVFTRDYYIMKKKTSWHKIKVEKEGLHLLNLKSCGAS